MTKILYKLNNTWNELEVDEVLVLGGQLLILKEVERQNKQREEIYQKNKKLMKEWDSIPWWKFWKKPSFEEQKSIIMSNWRSIENPMQISGEDGVGNDESIKNIPRANIIGKAEETKIITEIERGLNERTQKIIKRWK